MDAILENISVAETIAWYDNNFQTIILQCSKNYRSSPRVTRIEVASNMSGQLSIKYSVSIALKFLIRLFIELQFDVLIGQLSKCPLLNFTCNSENEFMIWNYNLREKVGLSFCKVFVVVKLYFSFCMCTHSKTSGPVQHLKSPFTSQHVSWSALSPSRGQESNGNLSEQSWALTPKRYNRCRCYFFSLVIRSTNF